MPMGEAGDYRFIDHHGEMIGAVMNRMDGKQRPMWNYYFGVPDIDRAAEAVRANGGTITFAPQEIPGGEYAVNDVDPQGAQLWLVGDKIEGVRHEYSRKPSGQAALGRSARSRARGKVCRRDGDDGI